MNDAVPKPDFPERGDNFVTIGPWRMLSGETWHSWQLDAEATHVRASRASADELGAQRAELRRRRLKAEGPVPVPSPGGAVVVPGGHAGRR
jgi:hypothetical protein